MPADNMQEVKLISIEKIFPYESNVKQQLRQEFIYRSDGCLYRKVKGEIINRPSRTINRKRGYYYTSFQGKKVMTSRLIYIYHNGEIPEGLYIDHINGDRLDNRIENLRLVTKHENEFNTRAKGYNYYKAGEKSGNVWQASIGINNKRIYLGRYKTEEEARDAYLSAKAVHHKIEERQDASRVN